MGAVTDDVDISWACSGGVDKYGSMSGFKV
jgi:hypothetical protein